MSDSYDDWEGELCFTGNEKVIHNVEMLKKAFTRIAEKAHEVTYGE